MSFAAIKKNGPQKIKIYNNYLEKQVSRDITGWNNQLEMIPSVVILLKTFQVGSYCVELSNAGINWFSDGFFPSASRLWNSTPFFCISGCLQKAGLITTLGTRWHEFFFSLYITIALSKYFSNLLYSFQCFPFPFLKGCRLEKGHIVLVLFSRS